MHGGGVHTRLSDWISECTLLNQKYVFYSKMKWSTIAYKPCYEKWPFKRSCWIFFKQVWFLRKFSPLRISGISHIPESSQWLAFFLVAPDGEGWNADVLTSGSLFLSCDLVLLQSQSCREVNHWSGFIPNLCAIMPASQPELASKMNSLWASSALHSALYLEGEGFCSLGNSTPWESSFHVRVHVESSLRGSG